MKFSIIATLVVLALAQGSLAQDMPDLEKFTQYLEEMRTRMTQQLTEAMRSQDLSSQALTYLEDKKAQLEPVAAKIQEQLQSAAANFEGQIQPMAATLQGQVAPMVEKFQKQMEELLKQMTQQVQAITN